MPKFNFPGQESSTDYTSRDIKAPPQPANPPAVPVPHEEQTVNVQRRATAMRLAIDSSPTGIHTGPLVDRAEQIDAFLAGNVHTVRPGGATRVPNPYLDRVVQK